jgi:hypothetical protein
MKHSILLLIACLAAFSTAYAQDQSITFQAKDLQLIAQRYTGAQQNWPLVVELASHNSENNSFTLPSAAVLRLQNFSALSTNVTKQQKRVQDLISSGATIFAPDELKQAKLLFTEFRKSVQNGALDKAVTYAEAIPDAVNNLEQTLLANRLVDVQAQITKKDGEVDKRKGLLGSWEAAFKGDLLKQLDGLRTMIESYANLSFTDGSVVTIEPNTEAVIRKSRIDKLDESSDNEITLENGSLLAKLSASAKSKSTYVLNAGPSTSKLSSQNFYAEAEGAQKAKLTNYDGIAVVNANDVSITIAKNEGTIVEEGKDPLPPIKLLPAPQMVWATRDRIIYKAEILFAFTEVKKAVNYRVQYSTSANFDGEVHTIQTRQTSAMLKELPLGTTYVRVQAVDNLGLKGPQSETIRIIRNIDNKPPALFIDDTRNDLLFSLTNSVTISGVTEPNAHLEANEKPIAINGAGHFKIHRTNLEKDQVIVFTSVDDSGNKTEKKLRVIHLTEDVLFNLHIQGASGRNPIQATQSELVISGKAYPGLLVQVNMAGLNKSVRTDIRGRWGITVNAQNGPLNISFQNAYSGQNYLTKSYTMQGPQ